MSDGDEPTRAELETRVERLESLVSTLTPNGVTRRDAIGGAATLAGGALLGSMATPARAAPAGSFVETAEIKGQGGNRHLDLTSSGPTEFDFDLADSGGNVIIGADNVASGSVTLSSGSATVDTGVGSGTTATFYVALGPDTDDAEVAAAIRAASGGNYKVYIEETGDTSVGNPTVRYDIVRVR
jgi:hypothetical protein